MRFSDGQSNVHALQTAFTRRMSNQFQVSATYTLSATYYRNVLPLNPGCQYPMYAPGKCDIPFTVAPDLGGQYGEGPGDQRHRAVVNTIWMLPHEFQLSGLYFFGSGQHFSTVYGSDLRGTGGTSGLLRPNGTIIPINSFVGKPVDRVDLRLQRRFRLGRRVVVDGILETFNLLNHANYGAYVTNQAAVNFGAPSFNSNVAYAPRTIQLGFRSTF